MFSLLALTKAISIPAKNIMETNEEIHKMSVQSIP